MGGPKDKSVSMKSVTEKLEAEKVKEVEERDRK